MVEPIGQIIARPGSVGDQQEIPNEDALSLVFDDTLLFDIDKFSGYDRIETGTRANVGVRYTAQFASGAYGRAVFGQSYQIAGQNEYDTDVLPDERPCHRHVRLCGRPLHSSLRRISASRRSRASMRTTFDIKRTDLVN